MTQLLPCPLCGHLHPKPTHHSKFKCKGCTKWLELPKGQTKLQDFEARKAAEAAKTDAHWNKQAMERSRKRGEDFDTAKAAILAKHNANTEDMRAAHSVKNLFPPIEDETPRPTPKPQPYTNTTKPMVVMSTTTDDDSNAPF